MTPTIDYHLLTRHCRLQILQVMQQSTMAATPEALRLRERAYGIYMGWLALTEPSADPAIFAVDNAVLNLLTHA
jgi:hypothetical protein